MAAPTNTIVTSNQVGAREDLENDIYRVAPEETPFTSNIGKAPKAKAVNHEWQTEDLATPVATNAQYEGDDVGTPSAGNAPTRVGNYTQIFRKDGSVSGTQEAVDLAGRESELDRQKMLKGLELKRDVEMRFIGNYASIAETPGTTPRKAAGALAWLTTATNRGSGGSNGGYGSGVVAAATNGTQRTFTEAQVKAVLATAFSNGARFSQGYMGPTQKQGFSAFTGIADVRADASGDKPATIYGAADVYVNDFGKLVLIPHAYGLTRDALFIDPKMWGVSTLRPTFSKTLASSGDNEKFALITEKTLVCRNQRGGGVVADLS